MSEKPPPKPVGPLFMAVGVLIILLAVGVIPSDGGAAGPVWVGAVAGAAFVFAGMSVTLMSRGVPQDHPVYALLGCLVITTLAAPFNWIAFGPGERLFSGGLSIPGLSLYSDNASELSGRIAFGIGAVLMNIMFVFAWRGLVKKLIAARH